MIGSIFTKMVLLPLSIITIGSHPYTSKVNGLTYQEYMAYDITIQYQPSSASKVFVFDVNNQSVSTNSNNYSDLATYYNSYQVFGDLLSEFDYFDFALVSTTIDNYDVVRFFAPSNNLINGVEFSSNVVFSIRSDDYDGSNLGVYSPTYNNGSKTLTNYVLIQDNVSFSISSNASGNGSVYYSLFYSYVFVKPHDSTIGATWQFNLHLLNVDGGNYQSGYDAGYTNGKTDGLGEGYANGYQDGLNLSQNGNFHSLFNSIADTPLRFLYGLFNFDLFGISMLVIIMSLLTGIVVFGLVKKFWK